MSSIKQVAQMAGVSVSTVSRVMNGTKRVDEETKSRVLTIIDQLKYTPNPLARTMRMQKSNNIGVIVPDITDPFFAELYSVIWKTLKEFDYNAFLINIVPFSPIFQEKDFFHNMNFWHMEGVVFCFYGDDTIWEHTLSYGKVGIPAVVIDCWPIREDYRGIFIDIEEGMYKAVKYFLNQGHRRIAFFGGKREWYGSISEWPDPRIKGYRRALYEEGIEFDENLMFDCELNINGGQAAAEEFIHLEDRPGAIVTVNDSIACGAIKLFQKKGIRVPEDVAVIGYDDNLLAKAAHPELSTVRVPVASIGESAAKMLVNQMGRKPGKITKQTISTELIIRGTTK